LGENSVFGLFWVKIVFEAILGENRVFRLFWEKIVFFGYFG